MDFLLENWAAISGIIGIALGLLAAIAELTPNDTDNQIVAALRKIWGKIPIGTTDPAKMGRMPK